jgi:hypothetical protein
MISYKNPTYKLEFTKTTTINSVIRDTNFLIGIWLSILAPLSIIFICKTELKQSKALNNKTNQSNNEMWLSLTCDRHGTPSTWYECGNAPIFLPQPKNSAKTQPFFTQNNSTNKQSKSQIGRTSEYDCISKPEISWRYFGSNRPFNSIAIRFHRCLWMGLGISGEGLRGVKYLSIEQRERLRVSESEFQANRLLLSFFSFFLFFFFPPVPLFYLTCAWNGAVAIKRGPKRKISVKFTNSPFSAFGTANQKIQKGRGALNKQITEREKRRGRAEGRETKESEREKIGTRGRF